MTEIEIPRLQKLYKDKGITDLIDTFAYQNLLRVPKINKIVLNMGIGENVSDSKKINSAVDALELISGQKPIKTIAKKAIAGFKLREGLKEKDNKAAYLQASRTNIRFSTKSDYYQ